MGLISSLKANAAAWLTSGTLRSLKRIKVELGRRMHGRDHEILYFHRADDPYCQLMVQILPEFAKRFKVKIKPIVVERLPANMYPDPQRYEAYAIIDAARLARLYGLGFPSDALVPDALSAGMVNRYLASQQGNADFFPMAEEVGSALWRRAVGKIKETCDVARVKDISLRGNEKKLRSLGHYASASLYYGGEWYAGLDRLDHLEDRLNKQGLGSDNEIQTGLSRLWRFNLGSVGPRAQGKVVELFFSIRSPYSYLALEQLLHLCTEVGATLKLRPVLPMVMRGMQVPLQKKHYILTDAKREAEAADLPFGKMVDPLGKATENALKIGCYLAEEDPGKVAVFYRTFMRCVVAKGIDGASDSGLATICEKAGVHPANVREAMTDQSWRDVVENNRQEMLAMGCWGVPSMRCGDTVVWGQDRIWAIVDALKDEPGH